MATPGLVESGIILKQGDTFSLSFEFTDDDGSPVTGAASKFKSQVRNKPKGVLYGELSVIEDSNKAGTYIIQSGITDGVQDTQTWKAGTAYFDIQYTDEDIVTSTHSIKFTVVGDITV